jgi:predicted GH43/DUF377 family glycosyl hydrolase
MTGASVLNKVPNIRLVLERFEKNPILNPDPGHAWESKAVFNPAALYEGGKVHILYRALGDDDVSVLGYASSLDGLHIQERLDKPAYVPRESFEGVNPSYQPQVAPSGLYMSGGGAMGGCEDPRLTRIDDRVYLTYVAYDGRSQPRVALSSIHIDDFLARKWNWKKPVLISAPHIVDKNAAILPEKIEGKYVIFHRVFPNILIDFVDDLDFDGRTRWLKGQYEIPVRASNSAWDNLKVGCGAPPMRTKYGWLLIYHSVGVNGGYHYKIGAMLLDIKDPTKVLARSKNPILEPAAWYENNGWKGGVVYPCGAAIVKDRLFVYYGGADTVVCVASVKLNGFLEQLTSAHQETAAVSSAEPSPAPATEPEKEEFEEAVQAYCLKCRKHQLIKYPCLRVLKNKRRAVEGVCTRCGSKVVKLLANARPVKKTVSKKKKGNKA